MSEYERERQEHIARNKERMMALQLPSLTHNMAPLKEARPAKPKGITAKRQKTKVGPTSSPCLTPACVPTYCRCVDTQTPRLPLGPPTHTPAPLPLREGLPCFITSLYLNNF